MEPPAQASNTTPAPRRPRLPPPMHPEPCSGYFRTLLFNDRRKTSGVGLRKLGDGCEHFLVFLSGARLRLSEKKG